MKQMLLKILKIFFISALVILAILLLFGLVLSLHWPLWAGFFLLLGLAGLGIVIILLRKIWQKRRENLFVQQMVDQDESYHKGLSEKEKDHLYQMQTRWAEAIEALRKSHLRKYGNPLYVLPWYLVLGESGSGKTTAIKSARLSSSFTEISQVSGISGTKNCDWWFFEQAIIIDSAGRYAIPIDEGRDKEEWQKFITLLAKYRKREPLNGLIVSIVANKLLEANPEKLQEDGRNIRRRMYELIRVIGAKPPVYVLVTKCDLIQGMTQFCDNLPEKSLNQAMGFLNKNLSTDVSGFLDRSINTLVDKIRDFRLLLLHKSESDIIDPGLLLFPEELRNIKSGLEIFIKEAFQENPYQESQILRGLFFSSGRQEGSPYSHFLNALGLIDQKEVLAGTSKGLFLHDFFSRILPKDRNLFAPTQLAVEWKRLTKNLGLTAWVAIGIAICGLLSFSFVKNMQTLNEFTREFSKPPIFQGEIVNDVVTMDRYREAILKVGSSNRNWWVPRFGLYETKDIEMKLKEKYCGQFRKGFLNHLDEGMTERMAQFSNSTPGEYISHLVKRINILKVCREDQNLDTLLSKPQPDYQPLLLLNDNEIVSEINVRFGKLYIYYLIWLLDSTEMNKEINLLQPWLKQILIEGDSDIHWLVAWANHQKSLSQITLEDFWGGALPPELKSSVEPAFTNAGKVEIEKFLKEIELALPDPGPPIIAKQTMEFNDWYRKAYFNSWYDFGDNFKNGIERLKGREDWQQMAVKMPIDKSPYFRLFDTMTEEIDALSEGEQVPSWVNLLYEFQEIKAQAIRKAAIKNKGILAKGTQKGKKFINKLERKTGKLGSTPLKSQLKAQKAYMDYTTALSEIASIVNSKNMTFQTASKVYSEDPLTSKIPFYTAHRALIELKNSIGTGETDQKMFWELATGPLEYLWTLVRREASCYLQNKWDETVLAEIQGTSSSANVYQILDNDGDAWKFVEGPAAPFMAWNRRKEYYATTALNEKMSFKENFLSFLTKGASIQRAANKTYKVTIEGKPTSANRGARLQPEATTLELKCADDTQRLDNYNFFCSETFNWSLETCEDIILQITVGDTTLTKQYTGHLAFPKFLKDFKGGKRKFFRKEFPRQASSLRQLGIKYIEVQYQFKGHKQVLTLLNTPTKVPTDIIACWD